MKQLSKKELRDRIAADTNTNAEVTPSSQTIANPIVIRLLQFAGKLALTTRLVTTANAKNLSQSIEQMEQALNEYDNEIIAVSRNNG